MIDWISRIASGGSTPVTSTESSGFVSLAPTDKADEKQVYSDALNWAIKQPDVFNIALTGPYGSGKSSIIKSFLKRHRRKALSISLAAFLPVEGGSNTKATRQEIERSILQQMLYGTDANQLPYSRFKRIRSPAKVLSWVHSFGIAVGVLSIWHMFQRYTHLLTTPPTLPFSLLELIDIGSIFGSAALVWATAHYLYVASFGLSLKAVSLSNVEMEVSAGNQESILNKYLDEIIYFFNSTKYEVVIIEDLDRFENPDIFVTLREINKIVNDNISRGRMIRFLYALRDDMFLSAERTKFFEFIVPVIPIINRSNSIDKMLEQGDRRSLNARLDKQFLREVSRYLDDLRLIQNIFNEYAIYISNLDSALDANKLLAVLIYKNVFPRDFEELHRGKGRLAEILALKAPLAVPSENAIRRQIAELESEIQASEEQTLKDTHELKRVYVMTAIERIFKTTSSFSGQVNFDASGSYSVAALLEPEQFSKLLSARKLRVSSPHGAYEVDITDLESEVDAKQTFEQRATAIERKSEIYVTQVRQKIRKLQEELAETRQAQLKDLIRRNPNEIISYFTQFGDQAELARYLLLEGYLDDSYYQYISLFHMGRLSPRDHQFLIKIRDFNTPEPMFQIDNPKEVIEAMRDEDFGQSYVLNVKIVDRILSEPSSRKERKQNIHKERKERLLAFMAANFDETEEFLAAYYANGVEVKTLVSALADSWTEFVPAALASKAASAHIGRMLALLPSTDMVKLAKAHPEFSQFLGANLPKVLSLGLDLDPERLKLIDVQVQDLASLEGHLEIVRYLFRNGLYRVSINNLDFIFRVVLDVADLQPLHSGHFTSILATNNEALRSKIERDFGTYLHEVLLKLDGNIHEAVEAIVMVLNRDEEAAESVVEFLTMQTKKLPTLPDLPSRFHVELFSSNKIEASWANCLAFIESEVFEDKVLSGYLALTEVVELLCSEQIPSTDQAFKLRDFVFQNLDWSDDIYRRYVRRLPRPFKNFPANANEARIAIVIAERKVVFSKGSFAALVAYPKLQVMHAALNFDLYFANPADFPSDDDFRENLLRENITDAQRLQVISLMDLSVLPDLPGRAKLIGPILFRAGHDIAKLGVDIGSALIEHSRPLDVQVGILNNIESSLDDSAIRQILAKLPTPYSEIKIGWDTPVLERNDGNERMVSWLKKRNLISSFSVGGWTKEKIRVNNFRK